MIDIDINKTDFDEYYKNIISKDDSEFYEIGGKSHYRLLAYLSTLYNNTTIIEIGTHTGYSALALSFNETNNVHTFDIFNKVVNNNIKSRNNINFHIEDLFKSECRNRWKETILKSPFIFLDIDTHNGSMEFDLYNYLKDINYQGFVICDDIWYFKEMRDNFWYKIEDKYKYDISEFGHWSGTGIFTFNDSIRFNKNNNSNWTLVTAYFNLTKCPDASKEIITRDQNYYISHSISTLSLPYNLVIYCDNDSLEKIKEIRPAYLNEKTHYIVREFDDFRFKKSTRYLNETFKTYREIININRQNKPYFFDNRNTASYYLFCMLRYIILKETIETNPFNSTHFCWINFCIERMGWKNIKHLDEGLSVNRDKFSTCYIDYIPESLIKNTHEYFKYGRCSMCSGFFTGNKEYMFKVCDLLENKFLEYLSQGYGHADEQLYSPVYFENTDLFEHYYGDYHEMITNYKYIYDKAEAPIYNFIQNSFNNQNYEKCYEACTFILHSLKMNKCYIEIYWLNELYNYYNKCSEIIITKKSSAF